MDNHEEEKAIAVVGQCSPYYWAISFTRLINCRPIYLPVDLLYIIRSKCLHRLFRTKKRKSADQTGSMRKRFRNEVDLPLNNAPLNMMIIVLIIVRCRPRQPRNRKIMIKIIFSGTRANQEEIINGGNSTTTTHLPAASTRDIQ